MKGPVKIGTRASRLAMAQTQMVVDALREADPALEVEIVQISSAGDRDQSTPLSEFSPGIFTNALDVALVNRHIDIAIHSLKDLPTVESEDLITIPVLERGDPRDVMVARWDNATFMDLPEGSTVGTSSPRREAQLRAGRPDLVYRPIRGNVETRIGKVKDPSQNLDFDAAILAAAGIIRLGLQDSIAEYFSPTVFVPAPGQGALAARLRTGDPQLRQPVESLVSASTASAVEAERHVLRLANAGCQMPIGAFAEVTTDTLSLTATVTSADGTWTHRVHVSGPVVDPEIVGRMAYEELLRQGSGDIMSKGSSR